MTSYSLLKFQNTELHSLSAVCLSSFTSTWRSHPTRPFQHLVFILLLGNLTQSPTNYSIQFQLILSLSCFLFFHFSVSTKIYSRLKLQSSRLPIFLISFFLFNFITLYLFSFTIFNCSYFWSVFNFIQCKRSVL